MKDVAIVAAVRTPVGKFQGAFAEMTAVQLGAVAVREAVKRAGIDANSVDECLMGCVLPAGLGQNPARQAALQGGLPDTVSAMTINMVCGSGLKAVALAAQAVMAGLWCACEDYHMGITGENVAEKQSITREKQDAYALASHRKASATWREGRFDAEVVPVSVPGKKGAV